MSWARLPPEVKGSWHAALPWTQLLHAMSATQGGHFFSVEMIILRTRVCEEPSLNYDFLHRSVETIYNIRIGQFD